MKKILYPLILAGLICIPAFVQAQQVIVTDDADYTTPATGAMLDVKSTTKGFLMPRVTTAQRTTLGNLTPGNGMLAYDTDLKSFWYWDVNTWRQMVASGILSETSVWDDIRVSLVARNNNTSATFSAFAGSNLYAWDFNGTSVDGLYFEVQMPHSWKQGTTIYPHVHWATATGGSATNVTWALDYEWKNIDQVFTGSVTTISTSVTASTTAFTQQITNIGSGITDATKVISSIMMCRLYRDGSADANNNDAFLLAFDIHYEIDSRGSSQITTK